jgi:hypothetical protein
LVPHEPLYVNVDDTSRALGCSQVDRGVVMTPRAQAILARLPAHLQATRSGKLLG